MFSDDGALWEVGEVGRGPLDEEKDTLGPEAVKGYKVREEIPPHDATRETIQAEQLKN